MTPNAPAPHGSRGDTQRSPARRALGLVFGLVVACSLCTLVGVAAGSTHAAASATAVSANATVESATVTMGDQYAAASRGSANGTAAITVERIGAETVRPAPTTAGAVGTVSTTGLGTAGAREPTTTIRARRFMQQQDECFPSEPDAFTGEAGSLVQVETTCGGYLLIGGDRQEDATSVTNYVDVLSVPSGGTTFTINTRLLGTDADSSEVFSNGVVSYAHSVGANNAPSGAFSGLSFETADGTDIATLHDLRQRMRISPLDRPLRPKRYQLVMTNGTVVLGEDGTTDAADPVDRSNLKLLQPEIELEQPGVYIAPQGTADQTDDLAQLRTVWTERGKVANGDRLIVGGFSTDGLRGTLDYLSADEQDAITPKRTGPTLLKDLLDAPEGVSLTIEQTDPGPNKDPAALTLDGASEEGLSLVFGPDREEFYLVVDTRERSLFDREFSPNASFEVTYSIESSDGERFEYVDPGAGKAPGPFETISGTDPGQYPYFGTDERVESVSTEYRIVEPRIEYDRQTRDDEVIVSNTTNERLPGYTNYAPGTEIEFQIISEDEQPPEQIDIEEVTIFSDGTFDPSVDLSTLDREYPLEIETYLRERLYDRRAVVLAQNPNDPVRFEIVDATENVTVARGSPLSSLTATIRNTGVDVGAQYVTLTAGERLLGNRSIFLTDGANTTIDYGTTRASIPLGNYTYRLSTGDDEATGTIEVVATPTPTPTPTTTRSPTPPPSTTVPTSTTGTSVPTSPPTSAAPTTAPTVGSPTGSATPGNGTTAPAEGSDGFLGGSFLGLGLVSTRAVVGAAAIVGGAYVVGYWK